MGESFFLILITMVSKTFMLQMDFLILKMIGFLSMILEILSPMKIFLAIPPLCQKVDLSTHLIMIMMET